MTRPQQLKSGRLRPRDCTLGFEEAGQGDLIVFLHGVGSDKSAWRPQLEALSDTYRCVSLDYPGYGDSDPAPSGTERTWLAKVIADAIKALGEKRAHIVGLSMGGVVALDLEAHHPDVVRSLTLADSFAFHPEGAAIDDRFQHAMRTMPMPEFAASRAPALVSSACPPALVQEIQKVLEGIPTRSVAWASPIVWRADHRPSLAKIRKPTLVVVGSDDRVTPPDLSLGLAQGIAGAKLVVVGGAGHLTNLEQPAAFNDALRAFLGGG